MATVREKVRQDENTVYLANLIEFRVYSFSALWPEVLKQIDVLTYKDPEEAQNLLLEFKKEICQVLEALEKRGPLKMPPIEGV